jgi:hypothetical protein
MTCSAFFYKSTDPLAVTDKDGVLVLPLGDTSGNEYMITANTVSGQDRAGKQQR